MLYRICKEIKNFFVHEKHSGTFSIVDGNLDADFLKDGQYFMISGSVLNDGVYQHPAQLTDEEFKGEIFSLAIPKSFLDLVAEIEAYEKSDAGKVSPYTSESFGGYSYSKASGQNGNGITWQGAFASKLNAWRKL